MNEIGKEYGTALFTLACEENCQELCADGLKTAARVFEENPDYLKLLSSPSIALPERLSSLDAAFKDKVPEYVLSLLKLMCQKRRILYFSDAQEAYDELWKASKQIRKITVKSAVPLTDLQKKQLKEKLEAINHCSTEIHYLIDPALLGGIVVETEDRVLDGSVRNRLQQVKEVMSI